MSDAPLDLNPLIGSPKIALVPPRVRHTPSSFPLASFAVFMTVGGGRAHRSRRQREGDRLGPGDRALGTVRVTSLLVALSVTCRRRQPISYAAHGDGALTLISCR